MNALTDAQIYLALQATEGFRAMANAIVSGNKALVRDDVGWPKITHYFDGRPEPRDIQKYMLAVARKSIDVLGSDL